MKRPFFLSVLLLSCCIASAQDSDRYLFCNNNLWGYIDHTGATVIEPVYHNAGKFSEGLASVRKGGTYGYIDAAGTTVLRPKYDYAGSFHNGRAIVYIDGLGYLITKQGKKITQAGYLSIERVDGTDLLKIQNENGYGFMDQTGKVILEPYYDHIHDFRYGLAHAYKFKRSGEDVRSEDVTIDPEGRVVPIPEETDYTLPEKMPDQRTASDLTLTYTHNSDTRALDYFYINTGGDTVRKFSESTSSNYDCPVYFEADRRAFTSVISDTQQEQPVAENGPICLSVEETGKEKHILISNCSADTVYCPVKDGTLMLFLQAADAHGEWKYITKIYPSGCGNSYYSAHLLPYTGADFLLPEMNGTDKVKMRVEMVYYHKAPESAWSEKSLSAYSNIFSGTINPGQLLDIERMTPTD